MSISKLQREKISKLTDLLSRSANGGIDFGGILELAEDLVSTDDETVRFITDAAIIDRLGKELVSVKETALSELVKNSYDADSERVTLTFENVSKPGGMLTIVDDGNGMTREEIAAGFMTLSSTEKAKNPLSPRFKRERAGRKGIGRFATQRLAKKLTIRTEAENAQNGYRIDIDWSLFAPNKRLSAVASRIERIPPTGNRGTTFLLEDLNDAWTDATLQRVYRYLLELLTPSANKGRSNNNERLSGTKNKLKDPGFDVVVVVKKDGKDELIINSDSEIIDNALAYIEARVVAGEGRCTIKSKILKLSETIKFNYRTRDEDRKFEHLDGVRLSVYYFILGKAGYVPTRISSSLEDFLKKNGGVRVYRNGFRVPPYGQAENDWLRLDYASGRRLVLPPFANSNFYGFVEIEDREGIRFQETSSREGLVNNSAYDELTNFAYGSLRAAALRIASTRNRKKTASEKGWQQEESVANQISSALQDLEEIAEAIEIEKDQGLGNSSPSNAERLKNLVGEIREHEAGRETERTQLIEELAMMRILAGLGMSIVTFTHEVKHTYAAMVAELDHITQQTTGKAQLGAKRLREHLSTFKAYTAYFDQAASANIHRELTIQDLAKIGREFCKMMSKNAATYGVDFSYEEDGKFDIFTTPMHWSEWHSILLNLYTNSLKAIQRKAKAGGAIKVKVGRSSDTVYLEFLDNGSGVSEEDRFRIFQPFFTTSDPIGPQTSDFDELRGMGLGLSIVTDTLEGYGGTIRIVDPPDNFVTMFRIEIPRATLEQIQAHGY